MAKNKMLAVCVTKNVSPTFEHDCEQCKFIAHIDGHDAYVCGGGVKSVVLRFGSDGPEYGSFPACAAPEGTVYALVLKLEKLYNEGIISKNKYYTRPLKRTFRPIRPGHLADSMM